MILLWKKIRPTDHWLEVAEKENVSICYIVDKVLPETATDTPAERWLVACPGFGQYLHDPLLLDTGAERQPPLPNNETFGPVPMH